MNTKQTIKGFTIIEVVLVLAIAGLIFLMVFVALPALQSGQRDSARTKDVGSIAAAVSTYSQTNRGTFPSSAAALGTYSEASGKWDGFMEAVSSNITSIEIYSQSTKASVTAVDGVATIVKQARCGDINKETITMEKGTTRQFAVVTLLEAGGGSAFCQDS